VAPREFIPVNAPLLGGNEKKYLAECIDSGWISSEGPFVSELEARFAARVKRRHAIAVTNGTAALDAAVEALGIGPGDEVILPAFTIISCIGQIIRAGATPVLVDSEPETWNMDVRAIEAKLTSRTRAIMLVHLYGLPVDVAPVLELAARHGLRVLEDAAEMLGQDYRGRPCGGFGDLSTFSLYANKHVTSGEGGLIVTDDDRLAETCRSLRNLCFQPERRFVHERLGWNLRLTNLQAAVALAQLERLDDAIARKRRMGARYARLLRGLPGARLPLPATDYADSVYWVYGIVLDEGRGIDATTAMRRLAEEGVGTRPFFCPMHLQPVLRRRGLFASERYPVAEHLYQQGFYLPSGLALTDAQIDLVAERVWKVLG
jgi:perosamine synthetase